jgi:hypothetical protein
MFNKKCVVNNELIHPCVEFLTTVFIQVYVIASYYQLCVEKSVNYYMWYAYGEKV